MSGTLIGGKKACKTNIERHGDDFYNRIGRKGGQVKGTKGGFASLHQNCDLISEPHRLAQCAGAIGGRKSRHGKSKVN